MKIKIEVPSSHEILIPVNADTGALLAAFAQCQLVASEGWGKGKVYTQADKENRLSLEVVADDFLVATPEPLKKLQEEKAAADSRWLEYYTKSSKLEAGIKALENDLKSRGITFTPFKAE